MKIVKITAMWCSSCLIMNKLFKKVINDYNFEVESLDYDMDEDKVKSLNVGDILPVFIIYKDDNEVSRIIGEKSEKEFRKVLDGVLDE